MPWDQPIPQPRPHWAEKGRGRPWGTQTRRGKAETSEPPCPGLDPDAPHALAELSGSSSPPRPAPRSCPAGRGPRAEAVQGGCLKEPPYLCFQAPPPQGAQAPLWCPWEGGPGEDGHAVCQGSGRGGWSQAWKEPHRPGLHVAPPGLCEEGFKCLQTTGGTKARAGTG